MLCHGGCTAERSEEAGSAKPVIAAAQDPKSVTDNAQPTTPSANVVDDVIVGTQRTFVTKSMEFQMVRVLRGKFRMGDLRATARPSAKKAAHSVNITKDFWMLQHEVTVDQFSRFVEATGHVTDAESRAELLRGYHIDSRAFVERNDFSWLSPGFPQTPVHPVVYVSYRDAETFCRWLNSDIARTVDYRLPTEAEWEYACRSKSENRFSFGDEISMMADHGNFPDASLSTLCAESNYINDWDDGFPFTSSVQSFKPNGNQLFDMYGNVWEWCSDVYSSKYYLESPQDDPQGRPVYPNAMRSARGGSWSSMIADSAFRNAWAESHVSGSLGFRIVAVPRAGTGR